MTETPKEYGQFLETLVIEEIIKEFNFKCKLDFIKTEEFYDGKTYYFKDDVLGIMWERHVNHREWFDIALRSPKCRDRIVEAE